MHRRSIIALALTMTLASFAAGAQTSPTRSVASREHAAQEAKRFIPGLEWFMNLIQIEHAKLWYAGGAGNWALAAYQLAEIKEIMADVQDLVPNFRKLPFADMIDTVVTGPVVDLETAIEGKDAKAFATGYDKLTDACNACHQAVGNGFIVLRRPAPGGFPNQDFHPHP